MEGKMKNRIFLKPLIAVLWLFFFLFFLVSRFSYGHLLDWIEYRIEEKADIELSIKGVTFRKDLSFLVSFVEIRKDFDKGLLQVGLKDVYLNPDIKMLIRGIPAFGFKGRVTKGGRIDGRYKGGEEGAVNLSWEGVGIKDIKLPLQNTFLPLSNSTNGDASLFILKKDKTKGSESIDIKLKGRGIPSAGFKVPVVRLFSGDVISGKVSIEIL